MEVLNGAIVCAVGETIIDNGNVVPKIAKLNGVVRMQLVLKFALQDDQSLEPVHGQILCFFRELYSHLRKELEKQTKAKEAKQGNNAT